MAKGHGGQQVGDALARTGACFNHQVLTLVKGSGHGTQHLHLLRTVLKAGKVLGKYAILFQHDGQLVDVQSAWSGCGDQFLFVLFGGKQRSQHLLASAELGGQLLADASLKGGTGQPSFQVAEDLLQRPVQTTSQAIDFLQGGQRQFGCVFQQGYKELHRRLCIIQGPVRAQVAQPQHLPQLAQAVTCRMRQQDTCQLEGVHSHIGQGQVVSVQEAQVKAHVVADQGLMAHKPAQRIDYLREPGSADHLVMGDPGQMLDLDGDGPAGIYQAGPGV